jgi:hypothetical protein
LAQQTGAGKRSRQDHPALPIITSRLIAGAWKGRRVREFGFAYGGIIRSNAQKAFADRMRCDAVLMELDGGLFVVSYTAPESQFPSGMAAFRKVLSSIRVRGTSAIAGGSLPSVPRFPGLTRIPATTRRY